MGNASTILWSALETFFSPREQVLLFLFSALLGVGLGVLFDCFRALRALIPHTRFFVGLEDVLFLLVWGFSLVTFAMEKGRGEVRFYYLLGSIIGFTLYFFTVGSVVNSVIKILIGTLFRISRGLYKFLVRPIVKIFVVIAKKSWDFFVRIHLRFKKIARNNQIHLKNSSKLLYNKIIRKKIVKDVKTDGNSRSKVNKSKNQKAGKAEG